MEAQHHIFHIGYHRTRTTFLQTVVFPKLQKELDAKSILLLSEEGFTGTTTADDLEKPEIIKRDHPNAKIIVTIRHQVGMLKSLYYLHIALGGCESFADFLQKALKHNKCDYASLLQRYIELFGYENVLVLVFEDYFGNVQKMVQKIIDFMDLNVDASVLDVDYEKMNPTASDTIIFARRWLHWLLPVKKSRLCYKIVKLYLMPVVEVIEALSRRLFKRGLYHFDFSKFHAEIQDTYQESNERLARLVDLRSWKNL